MVPIFRRLALLAAVAATPAHAQQYENLEMLDMRVAAALGANVGEPGGPTAPIDRRLRLLPCPQPAEIGEPHMGALAIRCDVRGWRIRVPLTGGGAAVTAAASQPQQRQAPIVRRGDQVELIALSSSFSVSTLATADQDGAPGDRIRVRTDRRSAPVIGLVLDDGRVALPGFN